MGAAGGMAGLGLYTWRIEPRWLQWVHRELGIRNLPRDLVGAKLVQISDLHISPQVDDDYLIAAFRKVNELAPEIVVYTGDFITNSEDVVEHAPRVMSKLARGSLGTFGILGNHDYGMGWQDSLVSDRVASLAEDAGVRILTNEMAETRGLKIVGLGDLWAHRFDPDHVLPKLTSKDASLVLVHNPDAVDLDRWGDYAGWILAGHTHGGQCKPPFLPPPLLPVKNRRYTSGEFKLSGGRRMYISRGIGHLTRVRFNARPEITVFELARGSVPTSEKSRT